MDEAQRKLNEDAARELVKDWPPLTPEQIERLRAILAPYLRR